MPTAAMPTDTICSDRFVRLNADGNLSFWE